MCDFIVHSCSSTLNANHQNGYVIVFRAIVLDALVAVTKHQQALLISITKYQ